MSKPVTCPACAEVRAAAVADHQRDGQPLTQTQADQIAAIWATAQARDPAA